MSRVVQILVVVVWLAAVGPTFATGGDLVSDYEWLHVAGDGTEPSDLTPADFEIDEATDRGLLGTEQPFIDLVERHVLRLKRDGTIATTTVVVRRYLTAEGVRNHGDLGITVRAGVEELLLVHASVRMTDGTQRPIDLHRAQVMTGGSPNVFSDLYDVILPFEGLAPGATAVLVATTTRDVGRWPLPWSAFFWPQGMAPIGRFELEAIWEAGVEPPTWTTDSDLVDCRTDANRLRCTAQNVPGLTLDPESLNFIEEFPQLVVSTGRSWSEVAQAEAELVARSIRDAGNLEPLLQRLLDGAETRMERIGRLHRFVADEIRYVSLSQGASAVAPAPVVRTLDRRYGDCKDKVATFLALARGAGLDAEAVLIATSRSDPAKLIGPSLHYFDHMIACVDGAGSEKRICIDLTAPSMRTGDLPPLIYGTVALDLSDETTAPRQVASPRFVWEFEIEATNRFASDGALTEELRRSFLGPGGGQVRAMLWGMSPEDRQRWLIEDYHEVMGSNIEPAVSATGNLSAEEALTLESTVEYKTQPVEELTEYNESDSWLLHYAGWFETENESRPYLLQGVRIRSRSIYLLTPETRIRFTGAALDMRSPFGELRRKYTRRSDGVEVETVLALPSSTIRPEDLARFRRFLGQGLAQTGIWFSLEPGRSVGGRAK